MILTWQQNTPKKKSERRLNMPKIMDGMLSKQQGMLIFGVNCCALAMREKAVFSMSTAHQQTLKITPLAFVVRLTAVNTLIREK
jgi:hypothetical protein